MEMIEYLRTQVPISFSNLNDNFDGLIENDMVA